MRNDAIQKHGEISKKKFRKVPGKTDKQMIDEKAISRTAAGARSQKSTILIQSG